MLGFGRKREEEVAVIVSEETETTEEGGPGSNGHCAWCGDPGDEFGSHGMCDMHREQKLGGYHWGKLQKVPSYVERFKDGRETWE
jgi:hypothetical protein